MDESTNHQQLVGLEAHWSFIDDTHPSDLLPVAITDLLEWAKDQALRRGTAGWDSEFDPTLFSCVDTLPIPHQITPSPVLEVFETFLDEQVKRDTYLQGHEGARRLLNSELDMLLMSQGMELRELMDLGDDYLAKVDELHKLENSPSPIPETFKAKIVKEANHNPANPEESHTELAIKYLPVHKSWQDTISDLEDTMQRIDHTGRLVTSTASGSWLYRFNLSPSCFPEESRERVINNEADYHNMVNLLRSNPGCTSVLIYRESIKKFTGTRDAGNRIQPSLSVVTRDNLTKSFPTTYGQLGHEKMDWSPPSNVSELTVESETPLISPADTEHALTPTQKIYAEGGATRKSQSDCPVQSPPGTFSQEQPLETKSPLPVRHKRGPGRPKGSGKKNLGDSATKSAPGSLKKRKNAIPCTESSLPVDRVSASNGNTTHSGTGIQQSPQPILESYPENFKLVADGPPFHRRSARAKNAPDRL